MSLLITSIKLPTHLSIFKTLIMQLKPSNQPQVKEKDLFCPLEVFKFVHAPKFYRAMRVYSRPNSRINLSHIDPPNQKILFLIFL